MEQSDCMDRQGGSNNAYIENANENESTKARVRGDWEPTETLLFQKQRESIDVSRVFSVTFGKICCDLLQEEIMNNSKPCTCVYLN